MSTFVASLSGRIVFVLGIFGLLLGGGIEGVRGQDVVVNDAADGFSPCDGGAGQSTIQDAIIAAPAGGTVFVCPGTYAENVIVDKSLTLEGNNAGTPGDGSRSAESVVDAGSASPSDAAFTIEADDVTIDGFRLAGSQGVVLDGSTASNPDDWVGATVQNNLVETDIVGVGIRNLATTSTRSFTIRDNQVALQQQEFVDPTNSGSEAGDDVGEETVGIVVSRLSGTATPTISGNVITDDGDDDMNGTPDPNPSGRDDGAFYGYILRGAEVSDGPVTISGGTVSGTLQAIAILDGQIVEPSDFRVENVTANAFAGVANNSAVNFHAGVFVFSAGSPGSVITTTGTITDVTIEETDVPDTANDPGGFEPSAGLYFGGFSNRFGNGNARQNVTVTDVTVRQNANRGVFARGFRAEVEVNRSTIEANGADPVSSANSGLGVIARRGATLTVRNSVVTNPGTQTNFVVDALQSTQPTSSSATTPGEPPVLTVTGSKIDRNGNGDLVSSGSGVVDASGNAWADGTVLTAAGTLDGLIDDGDADYSPFLDNGTDTDGSTPGFQEDRSTLNLDSGSPDAPSQAGTKLEEALALGGSDALRLQRTGGEYTVPSGGVTIPGRFRIADDLDFTTGGGTIVITDETGSRGELIVESGVSSITDSPTFDVRNRFEGESGTGNDTDWRILSSPRASVTGAALADDLDFSTSDGSILYTWDGATQEFVQGDNTTSTDLTSGKGFFLYFFDDATETVSPSSPITLNVTGPLDLGASFPSGDRFGTGSRDVSIPATPADDQTDTGYVLGVPFAQSFDLSNLTLSGGGPIGTNGEFKGVVQAWDPTAGADGQFVTITEDPGNTDRIAPWQGFWLERATTTSDEAETLTFESAGRTDGAPFVGRKATSSPRTGRLTVELRLTDGNGTVQSDSRTTLYLREGAKTTEEAYDASRMSPPTDEYAQVSFVGTDQTRRAQTSLPYDLTTSVERGLHVEAVGMSGTGVLTVPTRTNLPSGWVVGLTDTKRNTTVPLTPGTRYTFSLPSTKSATTTDDAGPDGGPQSGTVAGRFRVTVAPSGTLPVELAAFDGTTTEAGVRLTWRTASEQNNAGFRVQRRTDGGRGSWTTIGRKEGAGTTEQPQTYQFMDPNVPYAADSLTYRLKQVDTDGRVSVSDPITVAQRRPPTVQLLGTYPNPASARATVRYALPEQIDGAITLHLYDLLGRRVWTKTVSGDPGQHTQPLDVDGLSSGTYVLRLQAGSVLKTRKLTVAH